ncbi:MAG: hypothetical protein CMM99_03275 [Rickettsiales bacterium]|nr:hypothetical protein [Rickettsiales bacterium]|tara:strand:+ start:60 stop:578 length:519 start_codon:yes stop_codon:yes gene_type:complete
MFSRNLIILFFCFFSNLSYSNDNNQLLLHEKSKKYQDIFLLNLNDKKEELKVSKKEITIMNFWATWCPPCIKEIPQLLEIKQKYHDNINLIFVTMDLNVDAVIPKFLKKYKFKKMKIYKDSQMQLSEQLGVKILPTTIIFDQNINEISRIDGLIDWLDTKNIKVIEKLVKNL